MIDLDKYITAAQLSEAIGVSNATANKMLKEVGGGQMIGNTTFYDRESVRAAVALKYSRVLGFIYVEA